MNNVIVFSVVKYICLSYARHGSLMITICVTGRLRKWRRRMVWSSSVCRQRNTFVVSFIRQFLCSLISNMTIFNNANIEQVADYLRDPWPSGLSASLKIVRLVTLVRLWGGCWRFRLVLLTPTNGNAMYSLPLPEILIRPLSFSFGLYL